jgi:tetratricopeptide (TPR) repeat protein
MNEINEYYEILGLRPGASPGEIKQAYRDLIKVWHPDRFAHDVRLQQKAQEKTKEINDAYQRIISFKPKHKEETNYNNSGDESKSKQRNNSNHQYNKPQYHSPGFNIKSFYTKYIWHFLVIAIIGIVFIVILYDNRHPTKVDTPKHVIIPQPEKPIDRLITFKQEVEQGRYDEAISELIKLIKIYSNDEKVLFDQAINYFTQAITINHNHADNYYNRGRIYGMQKLYDQSISDFNKALAINPQHFGAVLMRGIGYMAKGSPDQAINDFNHVIKLYSNDSRAYRYRGLAYNKKGLYDKAIKDFNTASKLDPKESQIYHHRGIAYSMKDLYDKALEDFNTALKLNSQDGQIYYNRGLAYMFSGLHNQAIEDFNTALKLDPKYARAYFDRGMIYRYRKEYDKALADVYQARDLGIPIHPEFIQEIKQEQALVRRD